MTERHAHTIEGDDERPGGFRDVEVAGVDSGACQHLRDDVWDIHIRVSGSLPQAWRGLFDEEYRRSLNGESCSLRYADRHIVLECARMSETEDRLAQVRRIAERVNRRYRREVVPHLEEIDPRLRGGGRRRIEQRRLLQKLDPIVRDESTT